MKRLILIVSFIILGCAWGENRSPEDREYILLGDLKDFKGRLIKRAECGWDPGEDIWLKITRFDTLGNTIEEYGAQPYGRKYKETFKYDKQNRLIEQCSYSFVSKDNEFSDFENYDHKSKYELKDTLVDFGVTDNQLVRRMLYSFEDKGDMTREFRYHLDIDSLTHGINQMLTLDTLYKTIPLESQAIRQIHRK